MKNIRKTTDWIEMALEDLDAAVADVTAERYPASVFHAQQCTEKLLKAVLYFFGIIHEKTHFPSDILSEDILNNPEMTLELQLDKEQIKLLLKMVDNASSLEEQRSMPRYGWETRDRIIKPSEIYDELKAKEIMDRALETLDAVYAFFKSLNMVELGDVLEEMERCLKR
jgi:HEPN domain-containing protein